jgi:mono/diheme cytochrome c family protein
MFSRLTAVFIILALLLIACAPAPEVTRGEIIFTEHCAVCHSLVENQIIVGPSMDGLASRAGGRIDGMDAKSYLYASLREPSSYLVEGFRDLMPLNISKELTAQEQDDVIAYLLTLK